MAEAGVLPETCQPTAPRGIAAGAVRPRPGVVAGLAVLVVIVVPALAFGGLVLRHFYVLGSFFFDSGLLAELIGRGDLQLHTPPAFGGVSFFATHVTPVFLLTSSIARALPLTVPQVFAVFLGVSHALPALAAFWVLVAGYRLKAPLALCGAALLGVLFSFNGLALAMARYPHFEILLVGSALLFFAALSFRRFGLAVAFFALCLATREDAGFHLFALLTVLAVLDRAIGVPWSKQRAALAFAATGFAYSVVVLLLQHAVFAPEHSSLARVYLGDPPFGGLSFETVAIRLVGWIGFRTYVVLPAAIAVVWAVRARNPYILAGYIAFIPWTLLHLLAAAELPGTLSSYYAFPYFIASFWPLLGVLAGRERLGLSGSAREAVAGFLIMIAGSFTALSSQHNPGHINLPESLAAMPSLSLETATDDGIAEIVRAVDPARLLVDGSILALAPEVFPAPSRLTETPVIRPDAVLYFAGGYEAALARRTAAGLGFDRTYRQPGTAIRIASARSLAGIAGLVAEVGASEAGGKAP